MLKFSAGYVKVNPNFVIQNIKVCKGNCKPVFAVLKNILQRGCPTIPSTLLRKEFGKIVEKDFLYDYSFNNVHWDYVIQGGTNSNPALFFYKSILPEILGDYGKTFIPECPLKYIIEDYENKAGIVERVDFYSPLYNAVIEIDGIQHEKTEEQKNKDKRRDDLLKANAIKVVRLTTNELENIYIIKNKLKSLRFNENYKKEVFKNCVIDDVDKRYMTAIRIELLLLTLYANNYIQLEDGLIQLNIFNNNDIDVETFKISANSFMFWLKNICSLQNIDFKMPEVVVNLVDSEETLSKNQGINICISLTDVYSQALYDNVIYISNDYFLYEDNLIYSKNQYNGPSTYLYKKNNYSVEVVGINYELSKEKHFDALKFLISNISYIYEDFRANQIDVILECLNNRSVIGVLPTGAGKSLCYQTAALLLPTKTLMIAPLQLLMLDQYENIKEKLGLTNCTYINSTNRLNLNLFEKNKSLITIISPERFFSEKFTNILKNDKYSVGFVVIDEAHCLSEWGHDFRTSYLCLSHNLSRFLPSSTFLMALTGTASHRVFEDIDCEFYNFKRKKTNAIFADNMRRDNLSIYIQKTSDKYKELIDNISPTLIGINKDKTLVFTKKKKSGLQDATDSACITLTNTIKKDALLNGKINQNLITYYASGDDDNYSINKEEVLEEFKNGKKLVVFATKAFGMGVDIPDIRKTIHYGLPSSFESLYQQFGRAGRDGKPSKCYVYYTPENSSVINSLFSIPPPAIRDIKRNLKSLEELQTNFYFIQSSNLDVDIEAKVVKKLLDIIKSIKPSSINSLSCQEIVKSLLNGMKYSQLEEALSRVDTAKIIIERALYRLFLLGEIEMWSVVYDSAISNPLFTHLKATRLSEIQKLEKLQYHIEKYETRFNFGSVNTFENRLKFLLVWANENYLQERIQTLKTLYEQCELFVSSEAFMTYVANYFSNDPIYVRLIDKNARLKEWIEPLKAHPEKTRVRIARLLESYDKIVPLNYVSGITRLRLEDFKNADGERRLRLALESVAQLTEEQRMYLFTNTCKFLSKEQQEIFIDCWLDYSVNDVKKIYDKTKSEICEKYMIVNFANELVKIGEKLNDRL